MLFKHREYRYINEFNEKNQICLHEFDSSDSEPGCFVNFHVDFHPVRDLRFD